MMALLVCDSRRLVVIANTAVIAMIDETICPKLLRGILVLIAFLRKSSH
jgi:hypothetical protein